MFRHRQGEERDGFGTQRVQGISLVPRQSAALGRIEDAG
jgi:hypothetical protein